MVAAMPLEQQMNAGLAINRDLPRLEILQKRIVPQTNDANQHFNEALIEGNMFREKGHIRAITGAMRRFRDESLTGKFEMSLTSQDIPIIDLNKMKGRDSQPVEQIRENINKFGNVEVAVYHPKAFIRECLLSVAQLRANNLIALKWKAPMYTIFNSVTRREETYDFSSHDAHSYHGVVWLNVKTETGEEKKDENGEKIRIPIGSVRVNYPQIPSIVLADISKPDKVAKMLRQLHMLASTDLDKGFNGVSAIEKLLESDYGKTLITNAAMGIFNTVERLVVIDYATFIKIFPKATKADYSNFLSMLMPTLMSLAGGISLKTNVPLGLVQANNMSQMLFHYALGDGVNYVSTAEQRLADGTPDDCNTLIIEYPKALRYTEKEGSDIYPFAGKVMGVLEQGRLLNGNAVES